MESESVKLDKKVLDEVRKIAKKQCRPITTQLRILVLDGIDIHNAIHEKEKSK